ncbi:MAG: iron-containing alcohol dehydrogenase [Clostridia bacterium]
MSYFEFENCARIISGENSVDTIDKELCAIGGKKVLIVTDKNIQKLSACKSIKAKIQANPALAIGAVYNNIDGASTVASIGEMYEIYRVSGCDSVLAFGGGSVIDAAKCLVLLLATQARNIFDSLGINSAIRNKKIPFGVVSTTVNGGWQVSKYVTIKDVATKKSVFIESDIMIPDFCILDPTLTMTLSEKAVVKSAVGILAYCVDSFIGKQSSILTRDFTKGALIQFNKAVRRIEQNDEGVETRAILMESSVLCGIAYTNSMVGMSHAIARALNTLYDCDFLSAICAVTKQCLLFNFEASESDYAQMFMYVADKEIYAATPLDKCASGFVDYVLKAVAELKDKFGLPVTLAQLKVPSQDIDLIANEVMRNYAVLANSKICGVDDVKTILNNCFGEV